ncbi:CotY/CotZ family spore coat protein [Mycoplasmatota bacterium WC44]
MNGIERGNTSTICKMVKEVDQRQKEAILQSSSCIGCDSSLVEATGNTIPISFFMCDGSAFEAFLEPGGDEKTPLFRVEEVFDDCTIKCRLIKRCSPATAEKHMQGMRCTDQTCVIDLNCVCCLQCFSPIFCRRCGN